MQGNNSGLLMKTIKKIPKITFRPAGRVLPFDRHQICSGINRVTFTLQHDREIVMFRFYFPLFIKLCMILFYKITNIVRALWLAERSVCMRVCKQGCGVKLFGFSRANHASTIWKSSRVQNSTSLLYLAIPSSAETWKIVTKKVSQFFFA